MSPEIKTSTFVMVIAYWFDHVYKKLLNNSDVFALKLHGGVTNEKVEHDLRWNEFLMFLAITVNVL